jgi:translation initiation factor IF-2
MRASSLIPLVVLIAAIGCGSAPEETGRASRVPARDLTLEPSPTAAVEVASPLEAPRPRPDQPRMHRPRRSPPSAPASDRRPAPPEAAPVAEIVTAPVAARTPAPAPRPVAHTAAADPRALAPGQTVTVIPASSGPSVGSDPAEAPPSRAGRAIMVGGHGGTCQPRGAMRLPR